MGPEVERNALADLRPGPAAQSLRLFEDEDRPAGPGQDRGGRRPGQPAPDDDRVVLIMVLVVGHGRLLVGILESAMRTGPTADL